MKSGVMLRRRTRGRSMSSLTHARAVQRLARAVGAYCLLTVAGSTFLCKPLNAQPSVVGQWSAVQTWPYRAIHAHVLPTGNVMFWDSYSNADHAQLWDPVANTMTPAAQAGY